MAPSTRKRYQLKNLVAKQATHLPGCRGEAVDECEP